MKICPYCQSVVDDNATQCPYCHRDLMYNNPSQGWQQQNYRPGFNQEEYYTRNNAFDDCAAGKSRGVTALLAILLGGLGVQYFYLGKVGAGLVTILLSLVTCGLWQIVVFFQGILLFFMSNADFERKYINTTSFMPLF